MINLESFEKKLYIPRDVKGEPNWEELKKIREIENLLKNHPAFVGLCPFGSIIKGYSEEDSDIDINIIYDSSRTPSLTSLDIYLQFRGLIEPSLGKVAVFRHIDINENQFLEDLKQENTGALVSYISAISRMVTGDKINYYREMAREKIKNIEQKQKKVILEKVLDSLVELDQGGFYKMSERISGIIKDQFIIHTEKLWRRRLEKLWGKW